MDKRKETVAKILELLDGLINLRDNDSRERMAEKFLDELTNEISARQAVAVAAVHSNLTLRDIS